MISPVLLYWEVLFFIIIWKLKIESHWAPICQQASNPTPPQLQKSGYTNETSKLIQYRNVHCLFQTFSMLISHIQDSHICQTIKFDHQIDFLMLVKESNWEWLINMGRKIGNMTSKLEGCNFALLQVLDLALDV